MNEPELVRNVLDHEAERIRCLLQCDFDGLAGLLAGTLLHVHTSGRAQTREEYLNEVGLRHFLAIDREADKAVVLDSNSVLLTGIVSQSFLKQGHPAPQHLRVFLAQIWRVGADGTHLLFYQATRVEPPTSQET